MGDNSSANEAHDSSSTDNDTENLSNVAVDSRVIKKFSYLAAALKVWFLFFYIPLFFFIIP